MKARTKRINRIMETELLRRQMEKTSYSPKNLVLFRLRNLVPI